MKRSITPLLFIGSLFAQYASTAEEPKDQSPEDQFLSNVRQLTYEGKRSGEGYFSADGTKMIFQSERHEGNPFYQIYLLDLETGDTDLISPGNGRTTCAWIHPSNEKVLFASTHLDKQSSQKQKEEYQERESSTKRRYSWNYDENYEIFDKELKTGKSRNLTNAKGYDAEGAYSPDGKWIVFASNRKAYERKLSKEEQKHFEKSKAYFMDIYLMKADGSEVRQLTDTPGYDGGPFFSADGKKICWRRFAPNHATAEIFTMNVDGTGEKQLTTLQHMSWAPYFHPSGEYVIFATNKHGFANFELYMVRADGKGEPVRVTAKEGFDGLPVFTPNGKQLSWTSKRSSDRSSQIFLANWNHENAREALKISDTNILSNQPTKGPISVEDLKFHIETLASEEFGGRLTGTTGEKLATAHVASAFQQAGLQPAGNDNSFFQNFPFESGVSLGDQNKLTVLPQNQVHTTKSWLPLSFSGNADIPATEIVFAGYGLVAPKAGKHGEYDSYVHLDVKDKWVLAFRYIPEEVDAKRRQHLWRFASLQNKASHARDRGAKGVIFVSGPNSKANHELIPLRDTGSTATTSIPVISITDALAEILLKPSGKCIQELQDKLDTGTPMMGFKLKGTKLAVKTDLIREKKQGRNVLGLLQTGDKPAKEIIVIGAHIDHLGNGAASSRASEQDRQQIHYGADDNASGSAVMMEIAQYMADLKSRGKLPTGFDLLFAAWSGEELGLIGSGFFMKKRHPHSRPIAAYLNMDMVGRFQDKLTLQGVGSSDIWIGVIERANIPVGIPIQINTDTNLPTDTTSFYPRGIPILNAFTNTHEDYHTPTDTPEKINYPRTKDVAQLMALVTRQLLKMEESPKYIATKGGSQKVKRGALRAYLGTIPDYATGGNKGVLLSGVAKEGPADKAGLKGGDYIIKLAGKKIENIYDYTNAIGALKIGEASDVEVRRKGKVVKLQITPGSRD